MTAALLTPVARRYAAAMGRAIVRSSARIDREFRTLLRQHAFDADQIRAFVAITPSAAARCRSLRSFLEQVDYFGARLAKLNVTPAEVNEVLHEFDPLLDSVLQGRFQPAREQLQLATVLTIQSAYYRVREAETQAFFGLYQAEVEARGLADLLHRFVRILTQTFHARAGRVVLNRSTSGKLSGPLYIRQGAREEALIADADMRGRYASYWSFPLGESVLAQFGFGTPYRWLPRERTLLEAAGKLCSEAIQRNHLEGEVRRWEAQARAAEQEERRRIGRELHDEAAQSLLLLRLQLDLLRRDAPEALRPGLQEAQDVADRTILEIRRIVAALSPAVLERLGLVSALRHLVTRFRNTQPMRVSLRISVPSEPFPMQTQEAIYRVAQECLQNIARHSQANRVNLSLKAADKSIRLSVTDNGAGFSAERASGKPMSFGLAGMRERAALLGGTLTVRSASGKGASILLELPRPCAQVSSNG